MTKYNGQKFLICLRLRMLSSSAGEAEKGSQRELCRWQLCFSHVFSQLQASPQSWTQRWLQVCFLMMKQIHTCVQTSYLSILEVAATYTDFALLSCCTGYLSSNAHQYKWQITPVSKEMPGEVVLLSSGFYKTHVILIPSSFLSKINYKLNQRVWLIRNLLKHLQNGCSES